MHPGIDNHQTLEMNNAGPMPIAIRPGIKICQFVFEETVGTGHYTGRFQYQEKP
jgi:dCTP deaminase